MLGLAPKKTGPKTRHKLTTEIMEFIKENLSKDSTLSSTKLVELVKKKFAIIVHRRSIDRALAVQKKMYPSDSIGKIQLKLDGPYNGRECLTIVEKSHTEACL